MDNSSNVKLCYVLENIISVLCISGMRKEVNKKLTPFCTFNLNISLLHIEHLDVRSIINNFKMKLIKVKYAKKGARPLNYINFFFSIVNCFFYSRNLQ